MVKAVSVADAYVVWMREGCLVKHLAPEAILDSVWSTMEKAKAHVEFRESQGEWHRANGGLVPCDNLTYEIRPFWRDDLEHLPEWWENEYLPEYEEEG